MFVPELNLPGEFGIESYEFNTPQSIIHHIITSLSEAGLALHLFEEEQNRMAHQSAERQASAADPSHRAEERQVRESRIDGYVASLGLTGLDAILYRVENYADIAVVLRREDRESQRYDWMNGVLPEEFVHSKSFVFAKAFLFALDSIGRLIGTLRQFSEIAEGVQPEQARFYNDFPDLIGVRDTAHHMEDRSRGLDRRGNQIEVGTLFVLNSLSGNLYTNTLESGRVGTVEVSAQSLAKVQVVVQNLVNLIEWGGTPRLYPRERTRF